MKNSLKYLCLILFTLCLLSFFAGCDGVKDNGAAEVTGTSAASDEATDDTENAGSAEAAPSGSEATEGGTDTETPETEKPEVVLKSFSVCGADLATFKVTSVSYDVKSILKELEDCITRAPMEEATYKLMKEDEQYIIIDTTEVIENKYSILVENGNLVIKGSYNSAENAIAYFCHDFVNDYGKAEIELEEGFIYEGFTEKKEVYTKKQLMSVLGEVYNDDEHLIIGQHGEQVGYLPSKTLGLFKEASGELPGLLGLDIGIYGMYIQEFTPEEWSQAICEIVDYCAAGGIIAFTNHLDNPFDPTNRVRGNLGEFEDLDGLEQNFEDLITEGTELNRAFKETIARDGLFLKQLRDNGVPVLWRPFHEMNGSWFWFCVTQNGFTVDSEKWADVWRYLHDYYTKELGLDNLVWVYGPNASDNFWDTPGKTMSTLYCYPGNKYVDMVGVDAYLNNGFDGILDGYKDIVEITGYIGALTEYGPSGTLIANKDKGEKQEDIFNCMDVYELLREIRDNDTKLSFIMSWNGQWRFSSLGKCDEFMALDYTLGAKELRALFDKYK